MDAYTVGATLGAGAPAMVADGELVMPDVYEKAEILENGPLRFAVRLTMFPAADGVVETRLISQDRGSHLARCEVSFDAEQTRTVAAGIVVHKSQPSSYTINKRMGYVTYADALDTPKGQNGQLYIGLLFPGRMKSLRYQALSEEWAGGIGHVLGQTVYSPGAPFVYYFGTGWSKYDVPSQGVWDALMQDYAVRQRRPLVVEVR